MHILLAGKGKMAQEMAMACASRGINLTRMGDKFERSNARNDKVAVNFGNSGGFLMLLELCEHLNIPIIQGSSDIDIPHGRKLVIVNAPNLAIPMVRFMRAFPLFARAIRTGMEFRIIESHQSEKQNISSTARIIAKSLNIPESAIAPIRDLGPQLSLGVPSEDLDGHAYHDFIFTGGEVDIKVSTKIRGREAYVKGAIALAKVLLAKPKPLENGIYQLEDILYLLPTK